MQASDGHSRRRWWILALGVLAQASTCSFLYGLAAVVPQYRSELGFSLTQAATVVGSPAVGLILTLIAWGYLADRYGERVVIASGLAGTAALLAWASTERSFVGLCVALACAGATAASVNAASGRMVLGWFSVSERGLAMGLRQTAQPLGVALAALFLPTVARDAGIGWAVGLPACAVGLLAVLVAVFVLDPPRPERRPGETSASPYRTPTLWRLHAASTLLVVPQFAVSGFTVVYLVSAQHWSSAAAGRLVFGAQLAGALGRIASGVWSDRVGSRMVPMRQLAVASTVVMLVIALGDGSSAPVAIAGLVAGAIVTVADNGLGFTAAAEFAGSSWAGRALGAQNTSQNIASAVTPTLLGALITSAGYGWAFAVAGVFPLLAIVATPVAAERRHRALAAERV